MPKFTQNNIIYVNQGQGIITDNPKYLLITTGMTECIGVLFQSKSNPNIKGLIHFDGDILYNQEVANQNLKAIKMNLQELTRKEDFEIIAFGGREEGRNRNHLSNAIYKNFDKDKIKFHYNSIEGHHCMQGDLTIASSGNFGKFTDVMRRENISISRYAVEYKREISTQEPINHKIVLFTDKDIELLKPKDVSITI